MKIILLGAVLLTASIAPLITSAATSSSVSNTSAAPDVKVMTQAQDPKADSRKNQSQPVKAGRPSTKAPAKQAK
jgi:hypothetical protein